MENVKISIPYNHGALKSAARMLDDMADKISPLGEVPAASYEDSDVADRSNIEAQIPVSQGGTKLDEEYSTPTEELDKTIDQSSESQPALNAAEIFGAAPEQQAQPTPTPTPTPTPEQSEPTAPNGVELDVDGLPWDARIHTERKTTLKSGQWKLKRGIDKDLVAEVKAELHAAMNATAPEQQAQPTPTPTPEQSASDGVPQDFPGLLARMTDEGIELETVQPIIESFGFTDFGTVATRPDLVPQIAQRIFGG